MRNKQRFFELREAAMIADNYRDDLINKIKEDAYLHYYHEHSTGGNAGSSPDACQGNSETRKESEESSKQRG